MLEQRKVILVLDLDHTLLNSTGLAEVGVVPSLRLCSSRAILRGAIELDAADCSPYPAFNVSQYMSSLPVFLSKESVLPLASLLYSPNQMEDRRCHAGRCKVCGEDESDMGRSTRQR